MTHDRGRPRVGISRCLLGDEVRYDGGHKFEPLIVSELGRSVEWISVCPEVEVGMGVPREPIQLVRHMGPRRNEPDVRDDGDLRLVGAHSAEDWTERMQTWAVMRVRELQAIGLCGYVLKARSPSCGPRDVPIHDPVSGTRVSIARGRFAGVLIALLPDLPVEDEDRLHDAAVRRQFLDRVLAYQRSALASGSSDTASGG